MVAVAATGCSGCREKKTVSETIVVETPAVTDTHNSQNSLDYWGTYKGTMPAADTPGIDLTVTLNRDGTYELTGLYVDRSADTKWEEKGTYTWDATGSRITLKDKGGDVSYFKVEENRIRMLNDDQSVITGELADLYILTKQSEE